MRNLTLALGIHEDETSLVSRLIAVFAITEMSQALGANAADALFLVRLGPTDLPLMISLSGVAVMVALILHGIGLARFGPSRWLPTLALGAAFWAGLEWVVVGLGQSWAYSVIWTSTQAIIGVTFIMVWNAAESACDTRQAKRLFPLFAAGGVLGGVVGNLISGPVASLVGVDDFLLLQALLLGLSFYLLMRTRPLFSEKVPAAAPGSIAGDLRATYATVRANQLLVLAAAAVFVMSMLFFLVVFPFNEAVASSFDSEAEVAGYLGVFSSVAATATFLVSLLLTKRLFASWGIIVALGVVPVVYLAGFSVWLVSFGLGTALLLRGVQRVAVNAVGSTAYTAVFDVLVGRQRGQVLTFMNAVPAQLGTMAAGGVLIAGSGLSRSAQFGFGLVLSVALLGIVAAMRPAYIDAIIAAVKQGLIGVFAFPHRGMVNPVDAEARRVLIGHLDDPRADTRALALAALARAEDESATPYIEALMSDEEASVRIVAFDTICRIDPNRIIERAASAIDDPAWEVRLNVLRALVAAGGPGYRELAARMLSDPHPQVAIAAATIVGDERAEEIVSELLRTHEAEAIRAVFEEVVRSGGSLRADPSLFLGHTDRGVRAAAAAAFQFWPGDPSQLLSGLDDPSLQVRRASATSLAHLPGGPNLIEGVLRSGSVNASDEVLRAITPAGVIEPGVLQWAGQEAQRVLTLRSLKAGLTPATSSAVEFLAEVLGDRADRLEGWVLMAITTTRNHEAMSIVERGLRAPNSETRAQAIEALEISGDRRALSIVLPLLERTAAGPAPDRRSALEALVTDFDPWLRALATSGLAGEEALDVEGSTRRPSRDLSPIVEDTLRSPLEPPTEGVETLNLVDRVIALHQVGTFSELDPEDLELIAKAVSEVRYQSGEQIYVDGTEGIEMLVIVEGTAVVSKGRGAHREVIETYGPGEHVGELALLQGGLRSADVSAGDGGLYGLRLSKEDLVSTLEERPKVALGMLTTLAKRLAHERASRAV